jgi:ribulose-5-phosphate 4-epimerase/fuculose-1-phosphate aldolase
MDEGYIKYHCHWDEKQCITPEEIDTINHWRNILYSHGLIGMYNNGIGFGNISIRQEHNTFLISGSATGGLSKLNETHYARVTSYNLETNELFCEGQSIASSESLTHAALYAIDPAIQAVVHVHHHECWLKGLNCLPTSPADIAYGTPEMATAVQSCFAQHKNTSNLIFMAGHEDGIISVGHTPEQAVGFLMQLLQEVS